TAINIPTMGTYHHGSPTPGKIPNNVKSMIPDPPAYPTLTSRIYISINETPAIKVWKTYNNGATNKKVNSIGSVIPVRNAVPAAVNNRPPTAFLFPGLAI